MSDSKYSQSDKITLYPLAELLCHKRRESSAGARWLPVLDMKVTDSSGIRHR